VIVILVFSRSMHVYAPPFVQLVESPQAFAGSPMQIDTWNREMMPNESSPFVAGPLPRHSYAPPDAICKSAASSFFSATDLQSMRHAISSIK
jgi:hypothetical protein